MVMVMWDCVCSDLLWDKIEEYFYLIVLCEVLQEDYQWIFVVIMVCDVDGVCDVMCVYLLCVIVEFMQVWC